MTTKDNDNDNKAETIGAEAKADYLAAFEAQNREPQVRNADNEWLGSWGGPSFRVGFVEEVNGPGAGEVAGVIPTRHEVLELAKYWAKCAVHIEYWWFLFEQVGSSETRQHSFAWRRVNRIHELLGADVDKAVADVYEELGKGANPRYWEVFLHGNDEQREAVHEEIARAMGEGDGNQNGQ
jgi:hypothetical protein